MKLLITRDLQDQNDYVPIRSLDELIQLDHEFFDMLECIRIDDYTLGMSVLFWLRDNYPKIYRGTTLTVNLASQYETLVLTHFINKHRKAVAYTMREKASGRRRFVSKRKD